MLKPAQLDRGAVSWVILLSSSINSLFYSSDSLVRPCAAGAFGELVFLYHNDHGLLGRGTDRGTTEQRGLAWDARGTLCTCNITFPLFPSSRDLGGVHSSIAVLFLME
jgi:hypothetical protein